LLLHLDTGTFLSWVRPCSPTLVVVVDAHAHILEEEEEIEGEEMLA
jgi:hypothetical protein